MRNICDNCKFTKLKTTNYCTPYEYDERGNVIYCQSYEPIKRNIINCIVNFIKRNDN
jgi:hypothetical protein